MIKMEKMTAYIGFVLTPEKKKLIRNIARKMNISMSEYIRYCIDRSSNIRMDKIEERFNKLEKMIYSLRGNSINKIEYSNLKPPKRVVEKKTTIVEINFRAVVTELKETFKTKNIRDILKPIQIEEELVKPIEIII